MILIPAGEFLMGSDPARDKDAEDEELPQHTLYLPDYYMAKTPVTNVQYAAFVQGTGHEHPDHWQGGKPPVGEEDHPVVHVTWKDAVSYCRWLSAITGKSYRLPSEAEWEKGARGIDGRIYPWGDQWDAKRCNSQERGPGRTTPVGAYPQGASPYDLLDMAGNVCEYTRTVYKTIPGLSSYTYPYNPEDGREDMADHIRVSRGRSFRFPAKCARCAFRSSELPITHYNDIGFRVCAVARQD